MRTHVLFVRFIALVFAISVLSPRSYSQSITSSDKKWEFGLGLGPMFFLGDLGGSAGIGKPFIMDLDMPMTKVSKNLYLNYYVREWLGFRVALNQGVLEGDDAQAPSKGGAEMDRLERNLSFRTNVLEGYVAAEFYPTVFLEKYDGLFGKLRPYGIVGFGMMKFNPKAKLDGQWIALHPLRLEGEGMAEYPDRKPYKLTQREIPMGFGVKYYLKENFYIGLEVLHRQLFTDYIDDVSKKYIDPVYFSNYLSPTDAANARRLYYRGTYQGAPGAVQRPQDVLNYQRGDPTLNDAYFSTILRFGWRLGRGENSRQLRQLRCPTFY